MKLPRTKIIVSLLVIAAVSALPSQAAIRLPRIFGDHMVLQRQLPIRIWGWADAAEKVTVALANRSATTTAGPDGRWSLKLDPIQAGGPHQMRLVGKNQLLLKDILIGEVWVGSGQSNMEFPLAMSAKGAKEIAAANHPSIRLFTVARNVAEKPVDDVQGSWTPCTPQTSTGFSAVSYYFGRKLQKELGVPIGLVNSSWGGTVCEAWNSPDVVPGNPAFAWVLQHCPTFKPGEPNQASVLYNGMIHPLIPLGIRGVIWYQGEGNVGGAAAYRRLFGGMIVDWRKHWGQGDFPFLFVQLAPYVYGADPRLLAEQWESQFKTLQVPNTGMAVTTDIGDLKDIHPRNKEDVGLRLALWALARTYGKPVVYSGPLYKSMSIEGDKIRIRFDHADGGLVAKNGPLTYFTIASADGKFLPAEAVIAGEAVVVSRPQLKSPKAVRFAWQQDAQPNLFNQSGLPASPFRTDNLPMLSGSP